MSLSELLGNVGVFGGAVMLCLVALSLYSVSLIADKHRRFRQALRQSQKFKPEFQKFLHGGEVQELVDAAQQNPLSHVGQVISAGIEEYRGARKAGSDPAASFELVTSVVEHSKVEVMIRMKRGLGILATIGSTAPFVGLFGTVVGIINAFRGIAATGSGGMAAVSGGIAEALVATALGIFVAIPAVVAFNQFTGTLERFQVEMNQSAAALVNYLFHVPEAAQKMEAAQKSQPQAQKVKVAEAANAAR